MPVEPNAEERFRIRVQRKVAIYSGSVGQVLRYIPISKNQQQYTSKSI